MTQGKETNYWLFQNNPNIFNLENALRYQALDTFAVTAHKKRIQLGDKIILWQTGKKAGVYGLATVASAVENMAITETEQSYFVEEIETELRVKLDVDYNLWSNPITKEMLPKIPSFKKFYAGLPGTNYKATGKQYQAILEIIKEMDVAAEEATEYAPVRLLNHPLNQILYGPPGTGKTYQSINHALAIIENRTLDELALEPRINLHQRFEQYMNQGLIGFVTFHQSFSYEDFVEGIKPVVQNNKVVYAVEDGIFKQMCLEARRHMMVALLQHLPNQEQYVEFNQLYKAFLDYLQSEHFSFFQTPKEKRVFLHRVQRMGNLSLRAAQSFSVQTIQKNNLKKLYKNYPSAEQIEPVDTEIRQLLGITNPRMYWAVFNELKKFEIGYLQNLSQQQVTEPTLDEPVVNELDIPALAENILRECPRMVLIIDEINRGNVASIFGELITLLEEDKREGKPEMLALILPYSKTLFAVPPNLHIVGTMNTTDRSVESLDIALRRRFTFCEMLPQPELIPKLAKQPVAAGVDLEKLLVAINQRLEVLLDKDYCIGHSYFLQIETLNDLRKVFDNKIIPLLQEYFFGDYGKIGLVLGKDFIKEKNYASDNIFADFTHEYANEFSQKRIYQLQTVRDLEESAFIRIYDKEYN